MLQFALVNLLNPLVLSIFFLWTSASLVAGELRFYPVPADVVQARMDRLKQKNEDRGNEVRLMFEEAGCKGEDLTQEKPEGGKSNVVCRLKGQTDETIVVGAHFDHVTKGSGAVDNWSGVSLLPSLFTSLSRLSARRYTWILIGFAREEQGLIGSSQYVRSLSKEQLAKVQAMINIDSIGMDSPKIWVQRSDPRLVRAAAALAKAVAVVIEGVDIQQVGDSDSHPFQARKIPVLDIHSVTQENLAILHSERDIRTAVSDAHHYQTYQFLAALTAWLDENFTRIPKQ
ncbi:MAG: DUF4910 domain-containing protein [Bryobacteraceae bacterium]|nr:DUF4910 domain-containing protein [Bryobacteraceae bacterium]